MPNLSNESFKLPSSYGFSGSNVKQLAAAGSANQTLVTLVLDKSGSVSSYWSSMAKAVQAVVKACSLSPRADSLMLRLVGFNNQLSEVHGFRPLAECHLGEYEESALGHPSGNTALFEATLNSINSTTAYAEQLDAQDISTNGIVIIITDGEDNSSSVTPSTVGQANRDALSSEKLESLVTILVGVNTSAGLNAYLQKFKDEANLSQYVALDEATDRKIAKLADFVSKSVSAQSMAIGSGGPSQSIALVV